MQAMRYFLKTDLLLTVGQVKLQCFLQHIFIKNF